MSTDISRQITSSRPRWIDQFARKGVMARFAKISCGQIRITDSSGEVIFGQPDSGGELMCRYQGDRASAFYADLAFGGTVAAGESYMQGCWTCSDLTALVRIMVRNRHVMEAVEGSLSRFKAPLLRSRPLAEPQYPELAAAAISKPITTWATRCLSCFSTPP